LAVQSLTLSDFRCFDSEMLEPHPDGLTVLRGPNGAGKTSVLEAVFWLAAGRSWRTSVRDALVRSGAERALLRADVIVGGRRLPMEADIPTAGMARTRLNRQVVTRRSAVAEAMRVVLFSPDDLTLVHGAPAGRRQLLDDVLAGRHPRFEDLERRVDRILRQRAALLQQCGGRLDSASAATLDVWDERLCQAGSDLADARADLVEQLAGPVSAAHHRITGGDAPVRLGYRRSWDGSLASALERSRQDDVRRRTTAVGPHRDEMEIWLESRPARTHASQGEQRSVALALRLGSFHLATDDGGVAPILLLDDVFSELDAVRSGRLVAELPPGQVLLTTAVDPPHGVTPDRIIDVCRGRIAAGTR